MTTLGPYTVHPAADAYPLIDGDEFDKLVESIRANGVREPLVLTHDRAVLIDGRNRFRACEKAGVKPEFTTLPADATELQILALIVDRNERRRDMNPGQRAMVALALEPMFAAATPKGRPVGERAATEKKMSPERDSFPADKNERKSTAKAAKAVGASRTSVARAKAVTRDAPDLAPKVLAGEITLDAADKQRKQRKQQERRQPEAQATPSTSPTPVSAAPVMVTLRTHKGDPVLVPPRKSKAVFNETSGAGISWAQWSWNPVTGCLHGCNYCYARDIATSEKMRAAYPIGFDPLFREDRLEAPANTRIPAQHRDDPAWRRVFVCSMADLYGRWVPDEWIERVHKACLASQQWDYIHLTKFPTRYVGLDFSPSSWVGTSVDEQKRVRIAEDAFRNIGDVKVKWLSLEPLLEPLEFTDLSMFDWVVIGAQTETCQPKGVVPAFAPPFEWVARIVAQAREAGCRVHLKPNLLGRTGPDFPGMQMPDEYPLLGAPRPLPVAGEIPGQTAIPV